MNKRSRLRPSSSFSGTDSASSRARKPSLRLTAAEKHVHVAAYRQSKQTQQAYCEAHGLKLSSFKNWIARHGDPRKGQFTAVTTPAKITTSHDEPRVEICRDSCKILLSHIDNTKMVIDIIQGVLSCN